MSPWYSGSHAVGTKAVPGARHEVSVQPRAWGPSRAAAAAGAPAQLEHTWRGTHLEGSSGGRLGRIRCRTELSTWSLCCLRPGFGSSWRKQQWAREGFGVSWLVSHWINPPGAAPAPRGARGRCRGTAAPREGGTGQVGRAPSSLGFGMWPRKAVADQGWCRRQNCSEQEAGLGTPKDPL